MAGYSAKSLADKLGYKAGMRVLVMNAPGDYWDRLPGVREQVQAASRSEFCELVHYFALDAGKLERALPDLVAHLAPAGMLWVSWAKTSSPLHTDLDDNEVRRQGLAAGLVDVKVVRVDNDWSGMKFVFRLKDRKEHGQAKI